MINWAHWHNEPYLVGGLILLGWLYALAIGPLRGGFADAHPVPRFRVVAFFTSLLLFYLAVGSPLDQAGERFLLSAHMVQHQIVIYPAALLFLVGLPAWLVRPATSWRPLRPLLRVLFNPIVAGLIYILTLSFWHVPFLYDWALRDKFVHIVEHLMFFGAALFYWWPAASPSAEFPPSRAGTQMLFQLGIVIGMTPLFFFITFASEVLYPTYEYAPRLIARLTPMDDQILGGILMKLGGLFVALVAFAWAFYVLQRQSGDAPRSAGGSARTKPASREIADAPRR